MTTALVLAAIAAPVSYLVGDIVQTPITPEEFARIAVALRGGFGGPDGTNYLNTVFGGTVLRATAPSLPGYEPTRLIDTWATGRVPGWRTAAALPVQVYFALPDRTVANRVILRPHPADPATTWVRAFAVAFSTESPDGPWDVVVDATLDPDSIHPPGSTAAAADDRFVVPTFDFPEAPVRWVRLEVRSGGHPEDYTSLGEFEVLYAPPSTIRPTVDARAGLTGASVPVRR